MSQMHKFYEQRQLYPYLLMLNQLNHTTPNLRCSCKKGT